jgi:hypothetical protein
MPSRDAAGTALYKPLPRIVSPGIFTLGLKILEGRPLADSTRKPRSPSSVNDTSGAAGSEAARRPAADGTVGNQQGDAIIGATEDAPCSRPSSLAELTFRIGSPAKSVRPTTAWLLVRSSGRFRRDGRLMRGAASRPTALD